MKKYSILLPLFCSFGSLWLACSEKMSSDTDTAIEMIGDSGDIVEEDSGDITEEDSGDIVETVCSDEEYEECIYPSPDYSPIEYDGYVFSHDNIPRTMASVIRYPSDATGALPIVIVSHGGSLNDSGHTLMKEWGEQLAMHGYVVIHVAHSTFPEENLAQFCTVYEIPMEECSLPTTNPSVVLKSLDAKVVMDTLPTLATWFADNTSITLDVDKVGSLGWSGGSQVPTTLSGAKRHVSPSVVVSIPDERLGAGVVLSPQGPGFSGYFDDETGTSMESVVRPLLIATGENDWKEGNPELLPAIRAQTYENLPSFDNHHRFLYSLLPIGTGGHGTYSLGDLESGDSTLVRYSLSLISAVRAHFDAHLQESESATQYLNSEKPLVLAGQDLATWSKK